jgi:hypothetical protein
MLLLNGLAARKDGAQDEGTNETWLQGCDPAGENIESPLDGA